MGTMSQQEYLIVFLSFILGLGITELLKNLRGLVQPQRTVRWHPLPLLWAALVLLGVAQFWWALYSITAAQVWQNYFAFLVLLTSGMLVYLACSFALPSEEGVDSVDLEDFYFSGPRRIWFFGSLLALLASTQGIDWLTDGISWTTVEWIRSVMGLLFGGMLASERRWLHWSGTLGALGLLVTFVIRFTLRL